MTDRELLEEIHYSETNPTRAAELFKNISKVKKDLDGIYDTIKHLTIYKKRTLSLHSLF